MKILYLDCFAGASGDMIIGALLDAGLPLEHLRQTLGSLSLGGWEIGAERVSRAGVAATKFRIDGPQARDGGRQPGGHAHAHPHPRPSGHDRPHEHDHPDDHHHAHEHGPEPAHEHAQGPDGHDEHHHSLEAIKARIGGSALSAAGKREAAALFERLAGVEAEIHQTPLERVHLHEVGAVDSIIDVVGAVAGFEWFAADRVEASPLNVGAGTVQCAHGTFPVPAPATARLLTGVPIYASGPRSELVTPTGALLITRYAERFGPLPPLRISRIGYGAGDRDFDGFPNVLRLFVGESSAEAGLEPVVLLECEIDDMNPQIFGALMDRLHEAGALDVFYAPVQMKKNRPGTLLTIVAPPDARERLAGLVFRETTTIGLRFQELSRERLLREIVEVVTPHGTVRVKVARRAGAVVNAAPEFDDCVALAARSGISIKEMQALALKAYLEAVQGS